MRILVETIAHEDQRYNTCGDWTFNSAFQEGDLVVEVSDLNNWKYESLIAIHEIIEAILCDDRGIGEVSVTEFDQAFQGNGEPGNAKDAPYRKEHIFATKIEKLIAKELGVNWQKYDRAINML